MTDGLLILYGVMFCLSIAGFGLFLISKPHLAIELQRRFYAKINWKIEPISMQKELRNTRIMGSILVALALITFSYLLTLVVVP